MINAKGIQGYPNLKHIVHPVEGHGPQAKCCSGCGSSVSPARGTVEGDGGLGVRDASPLPPVASDPVGTIARFLINSGRYPISNTGISGKGQVNF
jgi:hypothetical protein